MNSDQVGGLLRAVFAAVGGWAVGKGYVDGATATAVAGGLVTIGVAVWSFYTNKPGTTIPAKPVVEPAKYANQSGKDAS